MKRVRVVASLVALACLAVAGGCDSTPEALPPPGTTPWPTSSIPTCHGCVSTGVNDGRDPTAVGPHRVLDAERGGTVHVVSPARPSRLDVADDDPTVRSILGGLLVRSLTQYEYDPMENNDRLVPDLATDLGHGNHDHTVWTFTVRDGVRWADGSAVTVEQVRRGVAHAFAVDPPVPLRSVRVEGSTLTITLARPFTDLPYWAAQPFVGALRAQAHPVDADGPYQVRRFVPGRSLLLVHNPGWAPVTDPARSAYPARYRFTFGATSSQVQAVSDGEAAGTLTTGDVVVRGVPDRSRLVTGIAPCTTYWAPDHRTVTDVRVRQALGLAYPYTRAVVAAGGQPGITTIVGAGANLMPVSTIGRVELDVEPAPGAAEPRAARRLLASAHATGFVVRWYRPDDARGAAVAGVVSSALRRAGFRPRPIAVAPGLLERLQADPSGPVDVRVGTHCAAWPTGSSALAPLLRSTDVAGGDLGENLAAFSDPAVDAELDRIAALPPDAQPRGWDLLDRHLTRTEQPYVATGQVGRVMARTDDVMAMSDDPVLGMPTWKELWVKR